MATKTETNSKTLENRAKILQSELTMLYTERGAEAFKQLLDAVLADVRAPLPVGETIIEDAPEARISLEEHTRLLSQAKAFKQRLDKHKHLITVIEPQLADVVHRLENSIVADETQAIERVTTTEWKYSKKAYVALNGITPKSETSSVLRIATPSPF
jgi:hypothetical protein